MGNARKQIMDGFAFRFTHPDVAKAKKASVERRATNTERRVANEVQRQLKARAVDVEPGEQGERGPRGKAGAMGEQGPRGPKGDKGDKGDRGERGARGEKGERGTKTFTGPKAPKEAKPGDLWLKPDSVHHELGDDGKWRRVTDPPIRGPRGPAGAPGVGPRGRDGNRFLPGFGPPPAGKGQSGDAWFDLEIGDLYFKTRAGWGTPVFNLGARAYTGMGNPTEDPHDTDDILEGDEPASEEPSEAGSDSELDSSDTESEFDFDFG